MFKKVRVLLLLALCIVAIATIASCGTCDGEGSGEGCSRIVVQ